MADNEQMPILLNGNEVLLAVIDVVADADADHNLPFLPFHSSSSCRRQKPSFNRRRLLFVVLGVLGSIAVVMAIVLPLGGWSVHLAGLPLTDCIA